MAARARDSQRSRVENAERAFTQHLDNPLSVVQLQTLANRITRSSWFRKQGFNFTDIQVYVDSNRRTICHARPSNGLLEITLNVVHANAVGLLHEIAHHMPRQDRDGPIHGNEFAKNMLEAVRRWISPEAKKKLARIFLDHKVKSRVYSPEGKERLQATAAKNRSKFVKDDLVELLGELRPTGK